MVTWATPLPGIFTPAKRSAVMAAIRGSGNVATELRMMALLRADAGELADEELHPCAAQWSSLYDRMHTHEDDETARRCQIAADYGERADG